MSTTLADSIASDLFDKYREVNEEVKSVTNSAFIKFSPVN